MLRTYVSHRGPWSRGAVTVRTAAPQAAHEPLLVPQARHFSHANHQPPTTSLQPPANPTIRRQLPYLTLPADQAAACSSSTSVSSTNPSWLPSPARGASRRPRHRIRIRTHLPLPCERCSCASPDQRRSSRLRRRAPPPRIASPTNPRTPASGAESLGTGRGPVSISSPCPQKPALILVHSSRMPPAAPLRHNPLTVHVPHTAAPNLNLTPEEKRVYGDLFKQADPENLRVVTGDAAVTFFDKTRLDSRVLGEVGAGSREPSPARSIRLTTAVPDMANRRQGEPRVPDPRRVWYRTASHCPCPGRSRTSAGSGLSGRPIASIRRHASACRRRVPDSPGSGNWRRRPDPSPDAGQGGSVYQLV